MSFGELQKGILVQVERDFEKFMSMDECTKKPTYIDGCLMLLQSNLDISRGYHEQIMGHGKLEENLTKEELATVYEKIQHTYLLYRGQLLDALEKLSSKTTASAANTGASSSADCQFTACSKPLRLPSIEPPTFSGSYTSWRSYHDLFVSLIHSNESLSEIQKLHYLKSSVSGEAERLLQHLSLDSGNYNKAWELLKARYDHKRILVNAQLKLLIGQQSLVKESANGIKNLLDTSQECVHALANLGLPVDKWDAILIYLLFHKLPSFTQKLWEERLGSSRDLPTMKQFNDFLETRFRTLEVVDQQDSKVYSKPWSKTEVKKTFHTKTQERDIFQCKVCHQGQHSLRKCNRFQRMDVAQRLQIVGQVRVCDNCLAYSHFSRECPSTKNCYYCQQRHHTLLHVSNANTSDNTAQSQQHFSNTTLPQHHVSGNVKAFQSSINANAQTFNPPSDQPTTSRSISTCHTAQLQQDSQVLLATAVVKVQSSDGRFHNLRALIDMGSEATFITESAAQLLKLKKRKTFVEVSGLGLVSSGKTQSYVDISFASRHSTYTSAVKAFIFKSLTGLLPAHPMKHHKWHHLIGLPLADPEFHVSAPVDLLFGSQIYAEIILPEVVRSQEGPVAQKTQLGWIIFGNIPVESPRRFSGFTQLIDLDSQMRRFWEMEEVPFQIRESEENIACLVHFSKNTVRLDDGRYEVRLPFKDDRLPILGASREGALRRFEHLERRFQMDPKLKMDYSKCINEYKLLNHMEELDPSDGKINSPHHYYLPHHAVIKEASSTTKLRVVFDAAAKTSNGSSLNDHLLVGPKQQRDIVDIIIRWRKHQFTFTADIEKMYRQVSVSHLDRYYQLILWRDRQTEPIKTYRLKTVTFGTASAPYLAIRVIHQVAADEGHKYPAGAKAVLDDMYVDDLISGADTIEDARKIRDEARELLATAGLNLRKWTSNCKDLVADIPESDREIGFELPLDSTKSVKTLGIKWCPSSDSFSFQTFEANIEKVTKRTILSGIAKLFDPLGWISPCIIRAKIMMQQLWWKGIDWDQPVPDEVLDEWTTFCRELSAIEHIKIPRWISTHAFVKSIDVHGFSDASTKAYGAAVYVRVLDEFDNIHMQLVISKTKVAPIKTVTLPRLELCGAVMLASILNYTVNVLELTSVNTYAWTDSTITLAWIRAPPSKWTTFVSSRVSEIQRLTSCSIWRHVPTKHNPADLASRGVMPSTLEALYLWWKGPSYLHEHWDFQVPKQPSQTDTEEEKRPIKRHCALINFNDEAMDIINTVVNRFSKLTKLIRVLAFCKRFLSNCRKSTSSREFGNLTPNEIQAGTKIAIKATQRKMFPLELQQYLEKKTIAKSLQSLNAFVDAEGILRVGGRLQNSLLTYDEQHPVIINSNHHFTDLVIRNAHEKTYHGGVQQMTTYIRKTYWIPHIKRSVNK